ncbi:MAG: Cof-type HAD-IIB family hydrolase [Eubacterium sp.]|nr:Cof-type HAD-IIB family hydrolase [Eubacterium sp.]
MREIKLVTFDLDETALDSNKCLLPSTVQTVKKLVDIGIEVVPATGRVFTGVPEEVRDLPGVRYIIANNGGGVYDNKTGEILLEDGIDPIEAVPVLLDLETLPVMADPFVKDGAYMCKKNIPLIDKMATSEPMREYIRSTRRVVDSVARHIAESKEIIQKITINFGSDENGDRICYDETWEILNNYPELNSVSGGTNNIEVTRRGVSKASALEWLGAKLGIDASEMMAFGDSGNDAEMLEYVGLGIAVANAEQIALDVADYITESNNEDGIAKAVEKYWSKFEE